MKYEFESEFKLGQIIYCVRTDGCHVHIWKAKITSMWLDINKKKIQYFDQNGDEIDIKDDLYGYATNFKDLCNLLGAIKLKLSKDR